MQSQSALPETISAIPGPSQDALLEIGNVFFKQGRYGESFEYVEKALTVNIDYLLTCV